MSNFKVGERVVCVDDSIGLTTKTKTLVKNEIYTIYHIVGNAVFLEEINTVFFEGELYSLGYKASRFRKLDHQFSEDVCAKLIEDYKKELVTN